MTEKRPAHRATSYLDHATEFAEVMDAALRGRQWDGAALMGIYAAMHSSLAVTSLHRARFRTPENPREVVRLLRGLDLPGARARARALEEITSQMEAVARDPRPYGKHKATALTKKARSFVQWAADLVAAGKPQQP